LVPLQEEEEEEQTPVLWKLAWQHVVLYWALLWWYVYLATISFCLLGRVMGLDE
jgi:hypothetical protein